MHAATLTTSGVFRVGDCTVDRAGGRILRAGRVTHVEPRAMDVLAELARCAGRTASRDDLIAAVWGHPHISDESLSRCVSLVRQALGDQPPKPRLIETVPKRGYRMVAAVSGLIAHPSTAAPGDIAVLPFANLSGDPRKEHVADSLTELLITYLSMALLRVTSRTSSMHYKHTRMRMRAIAAELEVARVVEGSVLASDRYLQAVMQLIDVASDTHLLSRSYTREVDDAVLCHNELATAMARDIVGCIKP